MRREVLLGSAIALLALLAGPTAARAVMLPFSGTVSICVSYYAQQSCSNGMHWRVEGVAERNGSQLSLTPPDVTLTQPYPGGFRPVLMSAVLAQVGAGVVDLATHGVSGLGVVLEDLHIAASSTHATSIPLRVVESSTSWTTWIWQYVTDYADVVFDVATLGVDGVALGQAITTRPIESQSRTSVWERDATLAGQPWSVVAAFGPGGGVLQLVTPMRVRTQFAQGLLEHPMGNSAMVVDLVFVPEPATGLLLGLGTVVFGWMGRRAPRNG